MNSPFPLRFLPGPQRIGAGTAPTRPLRTFQISSRNLARARRNKSIPCLQRQSNLTDCFAVAVTSASKGLFRSRAQSVR